MMPLCPFFGGSIWTPYNMLLLMMTNCFCGMIDRRKAFSLISSRNHLSEILTIANLRYSASLIRTCAETEFRLCEVAITTTQRCHSAKIGVSVLNILGTILKYAYYTKPKCNNGTLDSFSVANFGFLISCAFRMRYHAVKWVTITKVLPFICGSFVPFSLHYDFQMDNRHVTACVFIPL